jgi:hypothetical protein
LGSEKIPRPSGSMVQAMSRIGLVAFGVLVVETVVDVAVTLTEGDVVELLVEERVVRGGELGIPKGVGRMD